MKYLQELLEQIGLSGDRIKMVNVSAAMGVQFAQHAKEFSDSVIKLGQNPIKNESKETAI